MISDVAIIGCGPVGALLGNLLGQAGLAVDIYERERDIYPLPRAVHFDGEVMRIFQSAGLDAFQAHERERLLTQITRAEVVHRRPMLSLDKCYGESELDDFFSSFKGPAVVSPRSTGWPAA